MKTLDEFQTDNDWGQVFADADYLCRESDPAFEMVPPGTPGEPRVTRADVVEILHEWSEACVEYADWTGVMVGRLADGRYVAATGGSDSSGWG